MRLFSCLLCLLSLSCKAPTRSAGISVDEHLRAVIWPETTVLAGANVADLKKTPFYGRYSRLLNLSSLTEATGQIGFDPRRDVDALLFESDAKRSLFVALGRFPATLPNLTRLSGSVVVSGTPDAMNSAREIQTRHAGGIPPEIQKELETIPKTEQIWLISRSGLPFLNLGMRSDVQSALSNIVAYVSGLTAGVQVGTGLSLDARVKCTSEVGAKRVHDALRGAIGFGRLSTRSDQIDLLKLYDAIHVTQSGTAVEVKADLAEKQVDELMTYLPAK